MKKYSLLLLISFLAFQVWLLFNLRFTAWPEMFAYPYLRNHGFLIYRDMIHPYPPLLTMGLSWIFSFFGYHLWVLKVVSWSVILLSSALVWFIVRFITKSEVYALFALAFYIFLQPFLEGNMLWFDIAIVPLILLSLLFALRKNLFFAGLFLAAAVLTKQTTGIYFVFTILYLIFIPKLSLKKLGPVFYGPLLLGVPLLVRLIQEGAFLDFFNWVFWYPLTEWGKVIGYVQMELATKDWLVILLLFIPLILRLTQHRNFLRDGTMQLLSLFLIAALIAVYPRFSFFHFQTAIALLVIIYGYLLSKIKITPLTAAYFLLPIAFIIFIVHKPVLALDWQKEARFYTNKDWEFSRIIQDKVPSDEKVYLLGLHSGLYAMSDRLPPSRWTDNFSWYLEIPGVQEEVISRWEQDPPGYIFWRTPSPGNPFDLGTYQPKKIVRWIEKNYTKEYEIEKGIWVWKKRLVVSGPVLSEVEVVEP